MRWLSLLSLDAVLVALTWQEVLARVPGIKLTIEERALLGISLWIIYSVDHLLDGRVAYRSPETSAAEVALSKKSYHMSGQAPRHDFVRKHSIFFLSASLLAIMIDTSLARHIGRSLLMGGLLVALVTGIYLFLNTYFLRHAIWPFGKEIVISLIFSIGCGLVPLCQIKESHHHLLIFWSMMLFFLLCLLNATLIARLERGVAGKALLMGLMPSALWTLPSGLALLLLNKFLGHYVIIDPFLWSVMGLSLVPEIAKYYGKEVASLATDGALVLGAVISFFG